MTDFAEIIELRKIGFETKMYHLDGNINSILDDLDNCKDKEILQKHIERIGGLLEEYHRLQLCGIETITVDVDFLQYVNGLLVDKYCDLL